MEATGQGCNHRPQQPPARPKAASSSRQNTGVAVRGHKTPWKASCACWDNPGVAIPTLGFTKAASG